MSDTDDGFDEEAARRELREKYEDEREDREQTARMSDLLLQGATMTNQHCDRCGSPIFRYEGEEFCPTCQHEAEQAQQAAGQQSEDQQPADQQQTAQRPAEQRPEAQQSANQQPADQQSAGQQADGQQSAARRPGGQQTTGESNAPADAHVSAGRRAPPSQVDAGQSDAGASDAQRAPSVDHTQQRGGGQRRSGSDAEDALESSISALARRAASADDPRTATEYLEAAREAAEALAALRHNA
ncbi:Sjogren's syndrome/scleroderma autoantigen 1 family protein [Halobacterium zhouii]|uniref:Sjogren's syndrome/scleroderma autoantigen 1 family protein n=1 Tax=Halobacterium zhouii TaxID=2902624 RepID=UPI0032C42AFE